MALVDSLRYVDAPVERVWELVTDWSAHTRWIPFTTVAIDADSPASEGLGTRFTGRTSIGPVGFDDPMTVTEWQPPAGPGGGRCLVHKRGRWLSGWAEIRVRPAAGGGSELSWLEDVRLRWVPGFADPVVTYLGTLLFNSTLRRLAAELG